MKTLREVAEALCPIRLGEDYDKTIYNMIDKACHNEWIDGFITGAQWREDNPVAADSASDPESDSIELCGLLWDRDNLTIGGYEKDGHHYYTWHEAMEAARSVGKRLPTRYEWEELCDLGSTWAVGSGVITTRTTRARYSFLLRAGKTLAASWSTRASTATIGPRCRTTKPTNTWAVSISSRTTSPRRISIIAPTASACGACGINDNFILQLSNNN